MVFPRFSGDDPVSWFFRAEHYFECQAITGDQCVHHASVYFEGPTIQWFRWFVAQNGRPTWEDLVDALTQHFGPSAYLDYNVELSKNRQIGTLVEYQEQFETLNNMVRDWPVGALVCTFVAGLKEDIQIEVQAQQPHSFSECFEMARTIEEKHIRLGSVR